MAKDVRINYIYATVEDWQRFDATCKHFGFVSKALVQNFITSFFNDHREFYSEAGVLDARLRGMEIEEYYRVLRDESESDLLNYGEEIPDFGVSPLDKVALPEDAVQKVYNYVTLDNYNSVLLKIARIVDSDSMVGVVSKIIQCQFGSYWEDNFRLLIELDEKGSLT